MLRSLFVFLGVVVLPGLASRGVEKAAPCEAPGFKEWIEDRRLIDAYESSCYTPDQTEATPIKVQLPRPDDHDFLKVVSGDVDSRVIEAWREIPAELDPLPGFSVDENSEARWKLPADASNREIEVATWIRERLQCAGLLQTALEAIKALGDARKDLSIQGRLRRVGFPVSLLRSFRSPTGEAITDLIRQGRSEDLAKAVFKFERADRTFEPAFENGDSELKLARVEIGGAVRDGGIIPGSGLDVAGKLIEALPDTRFLVSIPQNLLKPVQALAMASWPLRKKNQVTLMGSPLAVSGWAQDNGKGGRISVEDGVGAPAVLAPRYASLGEAPTIFVPGESLLLTSLDDEGVRVLHSSLLFQGGNLLLVRNAASKQRLLLLSENEMARNAALGLTREQIVEAFRTEFAVDRCVVLPLCSYHLDFDVTCRTIDGKPTALVNDPLALAREIIKTGAQALARQGIIPAAISDQTIASMGTTQEVSRATRLHELVDEARAGAGAAKLAACFKSQPIDVASANLAIFYIAVDWLRATEVEMLPSETAPAKRAYLQAMNRKLRALAEQRTTLEREGFAVVPVPSMPDLKVSMNYLNGISERDRFVMPAMSGFYSGVDAFVTAKVQSILGAGVRVIPIPCANLQQHHGALHCMVSAFPADIDTP